MGYVRMGVPEELVLKLANLLGARTFVETGTYYGGTTRWAARHFDHVFTIEINPEMSAQTANTLGRPVNVEFLVGDSAKVLPQVVTKLNQPAVFWLDGHFCGEGTGDIRCECPVLSELEAIAKAPHPIVLIDDARYFLGPPPPPHDASQWVNIDFLFKTLADLLPDHCTTIRDDVIVTVPKRLKPALDEDWRSLYTKRYPGLGIRRPGLFKRYFRAAVRRFR